MAEQRSVEDGIAKSTLHLLRTGGPRSVTVEAVAAHSGIAKTTIYRRHRDRREMLAAAMAWMASPEPIKLQADAPVRLRWFIQHAIEAVDDGIGFGGFASLLTGEDPEFSALFRQVLVDQRAKLAAVIDESKADGSMRVDIDTETLIDAVVGTHIAEQARTGQLGHDWPQRLFDLFWPAVKN